MVKPEGHSYKKHLIKSPKISDLNCAYVDVKVNDTYIYMYVCNPHTVNQPKCNKCIV